MGEDEKPEGETSSLMDVTKQPKASWAVFGLLAVIIAFLLFFVASLIDPAPPKSFRLATGASGGAYAAGGEVLRMHLEESGINIELVETSGSLENFSLLKSEDTSVDAAILQGGIGAEVAEDGELLSLGAIFLEPLFIFVRTEIEVNDLRDLAGRRVAVGPSGSGTRSLITMLFKENDLLQTDLIFSDEGGEAAAAALANGWVEAAVFVTSLDRPYIQELLRSPSVKLVSFDRAEAYERRHRYLSWVTLPRGVVDLAEDIPAADVTLLAPAASLVVTPDLHPALQELLLQATFDEYTNGDIIVAPGTFPRADLSAFPLSEEAERFFERGGPPFLQRYLPFWAANMVDRLWVFIIPLATLLYPLFKAAPPIYRWRIRRRIITWYKDLRALEVEGRDATSDDVRDRVKADLARILHEASHIEVPLSYNDDVYRLRSHIRFVMQILAERDEEESTTAVLASSDTAL